MSDLKRWAKIKTMKAPILYFLLVSCIFAGDLPSPFDGIEHPPKKVSSLPLPVDTGISPKLDPKKENPYDWIVDNIGDAIGKQVHFSRAILSYGFESSGLLRDIDQKRSAVTVSFDHDLIEADPEFPGSFEDFLTMQTEMIKNPGFISYYELTAVVEVRPVKSGNKHIGAPIHVVVKRIYSLKKIHRIKRSE